MPKPTFTNQQVIAQLDSGAQWNTSQLTYGFLQSAPSWDMGYEGNGFSQFTTAQREATRDIMELWDDLIAPSLAERTTSQQYANIKLGNTTSYISYAHAYLPGNYSWAGEVWLNAANYTGLYYPDPGDYYYMTIMHEVGHALGLEHPGHYNGGSPTYNNDAEYVQDTHQWTVMSYFSASYTGADWNGGSGWQYAQTPMVHDILAIQSMYGADTATRTGNTTYGFNSNAGNALYNFAQNSSPVLTIYDAGGIDTLDLSGFSQRAIINLAPGSYSSAGGSTSSMTYNIGIAINTWIENAIGGSGNDTIYGNSRDNHLSGGGGNDRLYGYDGNDTISGGAGTDWAHFTLSFASYTFQLLQSAIQVINVYIDTVLNDTEWFVFSDQTIGYSALATQLAPISYTEDADTVTLPSTGGNFLLLGGDDTITYTGGFATIDGGSGSDTLSFSGYGYAVWVNLDFSGAEVWTRNASHLNSGTWRAIADLTDVENFTGTAYSDSLTGNSADNIFRYTGGNDFINGAGGTDLVDYSAFGSAVWVDLTFAGIEGWTRDAAHLNSGTWRTITDLAGIENITGTAYADTIRGDNQANVINGGGANDILMGRGGNDVLDGGAGTADTAVYANAFAAYSFVFSGTDILITGAGEGTDTVRNTVEYFQFSDLTLARGALAAALTPPSFTEDDDTVSLSVLGGSFDALGGDDHITYMGGIVTIDGGSGSDTVDFSGFGAAIWVKLDYAGDEVWTRDLSHLDAGVWRSFANLDNVENIVGTAFADRLYGDGADNTFFYTGGFDLFAGDGGSDTADFSAFGSAVWVDLIFAGIEAWTRDAAHLNSGTWRTIADLSSIENITGTAYADTIRGDHQANIINGGAGNDLLTGNGGDDLFVFENLGGAKTITDFIAGAGSPDVLDVRAFGFTNLIEILAVADESANVTIQLDGNDSVTLLGVQAASLHADDFLFA